MTLSILFTFNNDLYESNIMSISVTIVPLLAAENYKIDLLNRNLSCYLQHLAQLMPFTGYCFC